LKWVFCYLLLFTQKLERCNTPEYVKPTISVQGRLLFTIQHWHRPLKLPLVPALFVAGVVPCKERPSGLSASPEMAALAGHLDARQTAMWVAVAVEERRPNGDIGRRGCQAAAFRSRCIKWLWDEEARLAMVRKKKGKWRQWLDIFGSIFWAFGLGFRPIKECGSGYTSGMGLLSQLVAKWADPI